ncbi:MAG: hypothetical protein AAF490_30555 [Chloroflexota bacterium]
MSAKHTNGIPLFWFKFVAVANSGNEMYVAGRSEKASFAVANQMNSQSRPLEERHQNFLNDLVSQLTNDGWEPDGKADLQWWSLRFRRPTSLRQSSFEKIKTAVLDFLRS